MRRSGQAAMEFLTTYGWAILVVLVAIGALAYFGVLNPSKYLPEKCLLTTGIGCRDFALQDNASRLVLRLTITNSIGTGMIIKDGGMNATSKGSSTICALDGSSPGWTTTIAAGDSAPFTCAFGLGTSPGTGQQGKVSLDMTYTTTQGVYAKRASGDISGTVQ